MRESLPEDAQHRRRGTIAAALGLVFFATWAIGCSNSNDRAASIVGPNGVTASHSADVTPVPRNTTVQWNEVARTLVASHNTNGPMASRVYALVSVAQLAAVLEVSHGHRGDTRAGEEDSRNAAIDAAIVRASADVLGGLYPDTASAAIIAELLDDPHGAAPEGPNGGPASGDSVGARVARAVLAHAASDGAAAANCPATPPLPATEFWHDDAVPPNPQPVLPCFGRVRTWLALDVTQFRADPPPAFGSAAFRVGLQEVRQISDTRTAAQLAIVDRWLDGNNSFQPPGHWNRIASDLITQRRLNPASSARVFAVLNMAMMDTHVACWDRKYTFWEIRPWMVDPVITTPRGQPHHPANPSGHACAGGAGSGTLAAFFPSKRDSLIALGAEEGFSTVLSGVHYRFDVDKGLQIGGAIAARAVAVHHLEDLLQDVVRQ